MALNSQQYQAIMRRYEQTRDANRLESERRREIVYARIPAYRELELSVGSTAVQRLQDILGGDESALSSMHDFVEDVGNQKHALLRQAGFPEDYLDPLWQCPLCRDTGYVDSADGSRAKCSCLKQQEIAILCEQSNLQDILVQNNFDKLSYSYYQGEDLSHFEKAVKICKDFVQNFIQDYQNLLFYGTVGTGKSFLSGCIANELLHAGYSVIYFSSLGLFDLLARYTFDTREKEALGSLYNDLYNCELVIIDDLGTELTNSFVASQLFACLNERHLRRKATIISTNLSLEELRDRYSDRVFSRITSNYTLCKLTGPDIRMSRKLSNIHTTE